MLCAKYDYKMDITVKQEEAFEDEKQAKAIEDAVVAVKNFNVTPQLAAEKMNAPLDKVLERLEK